MAVLLDFGTLARHLVLRVNELVNVDECKTILDDSWREILQAGEWSFAKADGIAITTKASRNDGTLQLTAGSADVVGTGTSFTSADIGGFLILNSQPYRITAVAGQTVTLSAAYAGSDDADATYSLVFPVYELAEGITYILSMTSTIGPLTELTQASLDEVDEDRSTTGEPCNYSYVSPNPTTGATRIEIWPVPTQRYHLPYVGLLSSSLSSISQIVADITPALMHHASAAACRVAYAKKLTSDNIEGAAGWLKLGADYEALAARALDNFSRRDSRRWGRDGESIGDTYDRLSGRTDIAAIGWWAGVR